MNKTPIAAIAGILLLVALVVGVSAYGQRGQGMMTDTGSSTCAYHDQMETVLETGTYEDLVNLRTETGRNMMPFVTDEASFQAQTERHAQMEAQGLEGTGCGGRGGQGARQGTGAGQGRGMHRANAGGDCPMRALS